MKLHPTTIAQHELYQEIADAIAEPTTLVFVDTNVLFWLFSLGREPRGEFFDWVAMLGTRFLVPVWAAHELYGYLRSNQAALTPLKAAIKSLQQSVEQAKAHVAMAADDRQVRGFADLATYQAEIDRLGQELMRLCGMTPATGWEDLASEILPFINDHVLDSNIFPILQWIDAEVAARVEGRIPPGFADHNKPENRFGDRMLWNEVVNHCHGKAAGSVIMLTNDNKDDWVYRPAGILDAAGRRQGNQREFETVLPSPLLLHELTTHTNMTELHVVSVEMLVVVMHRFARLPVPQLFRAVQPLMAPTAEEIAARTPRRRPPPNAEPDAADDQGGAQPATISTLAELMAPPAQPNPVFAATVAELVSADPFRQEAAIAGLGEQRDPPLAPSEWFALGKSVREAALGGLQSALNLIANTAADGTAPAEALAFFAGVLHGIYFEPAGRRRRLPLGTGAAAALSAAERQHLGPAVALIVEALQADVERYLALPLAGSRPAIAVVLDLERARGRSSVLLGMRVGARDLLEDIETGDADTLSVLIPQEGDDGFGRGTVAALRRAVAARYSVPEDWLNFDEPDASKLKWSNTKGFRRL